MQKFSMEELESMTDREFEIYKIERQLNMQEIQTEKMKKINRISITTLGLYITSIVLCIFSIIIAA